MKNKKGFTLIELLAVIVILAVIALIAVPQVLKILKQSRISAAEDSVYGIVKATETYYANYLLKNTGSAPASDLEFECKDNKCKTKDGDVLDFKGNVPKGGTITISKDGSTIKASDLVLNGFTCSYQNDEADCDGDGSASTPSTPAQQVYYAFGDPNDESIRTTDYTTLGKNVFVKLEGQQKSVCILNNGKLGCLENNKWDEYSNTSTVSAATGFNGISCSVFDWSRSDCKYDDFVFIIYQDGNIELITSIDNDSKGCRLVADNSVYCGPLAPPPSR